MTDGDARTTPRPAAYDEGAPGAPRREHRGFALLIGFDDDAAAAAGTDVRTVAETLHALVARVAPGAERELTLVTAPAGIDAPNLELVRRRLREAEPTTATTTPAAPLPALRRPPAVVIDVSRHRVSVDGRALSMTFGEFELLRRLVSNEGVALRREDLLGDGQQPDARAARAVDDLVRRVRQKLEPFGDVIRTVRGIGYRFDRHDDVLVRADAEGDASDTR
ncbi:winged helix-turn-helix domain-containing protein [Herbiconiux sp. SYSU D00978]|uniref:winged helix-turn-helix domain-containing protein n=1 Tax=Herbiconiux sp. SYSU D00978 TaxID=2812562 RepID=UPI001A95A5EE|nr:winged helix-turn-helix domain-containing protein [Herbiconiux sp. SYSU D00978]